MAFSLGIPIQHWHDRCHDKSLAHSQLENDGEKDAKGEADIFCDGRSGFNRLRGAYGCAS
jgi:hypothetical protein